MSSKPQLQHSFYIKHSPPDSHGLDLLGSVITSEALLSRPPLSIPSSHQGGRNSKASRISHYPVTSTNNARPNSSGITVSSAPPSSLHLANNNSCLLTSGSGKSGNNVNANNSLNQNQGGTTTTVSTPNNNNITNGGPQLTMSGVGAVTNGHQQPPMNLSFPRIPHSPDSALGGWSTPSSNLSRHNSDASQRSFSSSSNNTTPPSPSNSPLLSHNQSRIKVEDFGKESKISVPVFKNCILNRRNPVS